MHTHIYGSTLVTWSISLGAHILKAVYWPFFFPRKLRRWHPFTLSAWFKLISSTKTAIIVLFGCCLYPLCVCILLLFISNLLGAVQWHRIMTLAAPRACYTNNKQMISNNQEPLIQVSQLLSCGWGFKEPNRGLSNYQDLVFLYDPSEKASILAREHLMHIPLRMVALFACLVWVFFPPQMALVLKHLSGDYPLFSCFIGNNELWG